MKRWLGIAGISLIAGAVAAGARVYSRRSRERIASGESLDDPEVAQAFSWVARTPQMKLLRRYVAWRALALAPAGEAADLGCGPGYLVADLARRAPDLRITGIDLSEEMLREARAFCARAGVAGRAVFKQGDAGRIPLPDQSLDLVVSTLSLHHWDQPVQVLDEIARVVRPGGAYLVFDLRRDLAAPVYLLLWAATRLIVPAPLRRVGEPLGSRNASYTAGEAAALAGRSRLAGWRVTAGPLWLTVEGRAPLAGRAIG